MVDNNTFRYSVPTNKKIQSITCRINTAGCCSKYHFPYLHILDNKIYVSCLLKINFKSHWCFMPSLSSLENTSQQTAKPESTSTSINASQNVTKETAGITNVTRQISKFITDNTTAYQLTFQRRPVLQQYWHPMQQICKKLH